MQLILSRKGRQLIHLENDRKAVRTDQRCDTRDRASQPRRQHRNAAVTVCGTDWMPPPGERWDKDADHTQLATETAVQR